MLVVIIVMLGAVGAVAAWHAGAARSRAAAAARLRQAAAEIARLRDEAERANTRADEVAREKEAFMAGQEQGRRDVISVLPLLVTAQHRAPSPLPSLSGRGPLEAGARDGSASE